MGVKDLWKLLETTGRPVTLESLEGLVLAIGESRAEVSINNNYQYGELRPAKFHFFWDRVQ